MVGRWAGSNGTFKGRAVRGVTGDLMVGRWAGSNGRFKGRAAWHAAWRVMGDLRVGRWAEQ